MWKLLSKASIGAAAAALAVTTMSAPAHAESTNKALDTGPVTAIERVMSALERVQELPTSVREDAQAATTHQQAAPVPMPRPLPEGANTGSPGDIVTLPDELVQRLPERGVLTEELSNQVRQVAGDQLDRFGKVNLPDNRRLVTGPNGELILIDPEEVGGKGDKMVASGSTDGSAEQGSSDASEQEAAQENSGEQAQAQAQSAKLGGVVQQLLAPGGPLASLKGVSGGLGG